MEDRRTKDAGRRRAAAARVDMACSPMVGVFPPIEPRRRPAMLARWRLAHLAGMAELEAMAR